MPYIIGIAIALSVSTIIYVVLDALFSEERRVSRRLERIGDFSASALVEAEPLSAPFTERILAPIGSTVGGAVRSVTPTDYLKRIEVKLAAAGKTGATTPERILFTKIVIAIVALVGGVGIASIYDLGIAQTILAAIVAAAVFSMLPDAQLDSAASDRQKRIVRELPDMLDMLTISVQAGLGFDQAVTRYIRYADGPLAQEFALALREIQAGKTRREALRAMADRAGVPELKAFVMAIVQADVFGVSIADVLHTQSKEMRTKRRQRAEEMAQKAPAKMAFPLIACILPATVIVVLTPALIGIMDLFNTM